MDCSSEESLIRMKLEAFTEVQALEFELQDRRLTVYHIGEIDQIRESILELNLGGEILSTSKTTDVPVQEQEKQRKLLWTVLLINFSFFLIEVIFGWVAKSMGLIADSLDMLADAFVYALSLFAVGAAVSRKKNVAKLAGIFQIILALVGLMEVVRRFVGVEKVPEFGTMIIVSGLALVANSLCLILLQKSKSKEAHMRASMIFTSNDVVINLGVIVAGALVFWTGSAYPDLIIGIIVFVLVLWGARRILGLAK